MFENKKKEKSDPELILIINKIVHDLCIEFINYEYKLILPEVDLINSKLHKFCVLPLYSNWDNDLYTTVNDIYKSSVFQRFGARLNTLLSKIVCTVGIEYTTMIEIQAMHSVAWLSPDDELFKQLNILHPGFWIIVYLEQEYRKLLPVFLNKTVLE